MTDSTVKSNVAGVGRGSANGPAPEAATFRFLGAAFLVQAIGSAVSGLVLAPVDLLANSAPDDMAATMADIADSESLLRASIVGEMVTAAGIVALGTLLFAVLRRYGRNVAAIALGLYLVEAALLAMREVLVFALGSTSEQAATSGVTEALVAQGRCCTKRRPSPTRSTRSSSPPAPPSSTSCSPVRVCYPAFLSVWVSSLHRWP